MRLGVNIGPVHASGRVGGSRRSSGGAPVEMGSVTTIILGIVMAIIVLPIAAFLVWMFVTVFWSIPGGPVIVIGAGLLVVGIFVKEFFFTRT